MEVPQRLTYTEVKDPNFHAGMTYWDYSAHYTNSSHLMADMVSTTLAPYLTKYNVITTCWAYENLKNGYEKHQKQDGMQEVNM